MAVTASAVLVLAGWAMWEASRREQLTARRRAECSRTTFAILQRISRAVMRAETIDVPDPDHGGQSIQLHVPETGGTVRRAFRLSGDALIMDLKDEGVSPITIFDEISSLTFTILDAPTNSRVEIACSVMIDGEQVQMQTVASKRN